MAYDASEWKPGDVAMVTDRVFGGEPVRRIYGEYPPGGGGRWTEGHGGFLRAESAVARPLAVIDPEDAEEVRSLWLAIAQHAPLTAPEALQAALRDFARPTPRIEEPQGLGAVVVDAEGDRYVRWSARHRAERHWKGEEGGDYRTWADTNAIRILSEGVPS